jgi:hypothetical protein
MTEREARRVREALLAARHLSRAEDVPGGAGGFSMGRRLPQRMRARALAAEQLAQMGLDAATVETELAAERAQSDRRLQELKAHAVAQSGARAESLRRLVDARREALGGLVSVGQATTRYLTLDSPVEIWATDGVTLESSVIEPYNSRAQIRRDAKLYERWTGAYLIEWIDERLHFYYLWGNTESSASAVVTVSAFLTLNGFCSAKSQGGLFLGGKAELKLEPTLDLLQTWTQPLSSAPPQAGQSWTALDLIADSQGFDTDDQTTYQVEFRGFLLNYDQEIVPAGQYLIIDVALSLGSQVDNGEVSADFATGEFYVMSPLVQLTIVYPGIGQVGTAT